MMVDSSIVILENIYKITIELSTIIPSPKASPPSVRTFSDSPVKYMRENVETTAIGIDTPITIVARILFTKRSKTKNVMATLAEKYSCNNRNYGIDTNGRQIGGAHISTPVT